MRTGVAIVVLAALLAVPGTRAFSDGIVSIDTHNFDKVVTNDRTTIVKFDRKNPHNDDHEAWKKFAVRIGKMGKTNPILPAEVNCHIEWAWDDASYFNMDLAKRFNVKFNKNYKEHKPTFLLFKAGSINKPVRFTDPITPENLVRFVQRNTDVYFGLPGTLQKFDALAEGFLAASKSERKDMLKKAQRYVENVQWDDKEFAEFYITIMKKVMDRGENALKTERERLTRLKDKDSRVKDVQKKVFEKKLNVISSFKQDVKKEDGQE